MFRRHNVQDIFFLYKKHINANFKLKFGPYTMVNSILIAVNDM